MSIPFAIVDAFTDRPFAGNAAGVVTTADGLDGEQMRRIARELGQTETCFISTAAASGTDLVLRWFTPAVEVDLCGHATVAAFVCLAAEDRIAWVDDRARLTCATRSGPIDVWLARTAGGPPLVTMSVPVTALMLAPDDPAAVARAVGLPANALDPALPLVADPVSARVIVPVRRMDDLLGFTPNGAGMVAYDAYRRFTLLCLETRDPACVAHLRHFAPANGIPEDPVTGTAHAAVAVYLDQQGLLPAGERVVVVGEQGHAVHRPGTVTVEVRRQNGRITDVRIGGSGVIVARGEIALPEAGDGPG